MWSARAGTSESSSWPVTTLKPLASPRCVTGMPAAAGTEMAEVTPETTSTSTPCCRQNSASSPPRPRTYGSPPLSRTTRWPCRASSTRIRLISACGTGWWPGVLPTSIDADVGGQFVQEFAGAEAVRDDDVGLAQEPAAADGDEAGVAGSAAHEGHGSGGGAGARPAQRQVTGFQGGGDGVAQGHGAARVSPGVDGDLDVVHHGDGGRPGGGGFVVGGVDAPDALRLGVGRDLRVHGGDRRWRSGRTRRRRRRTGGTGAAPR